MRCLLCPLRLQHFLEIIRLLSAEGPSELLLLPRSSTETPSSYPRSSAPIRQSHLFIRASPAVSFEPIVFSPMLLLILARLLLFDVHISSHALFQLFQSNLVFFLMRRFCFQLGLKLMKDCLGTHLVKLGVSFFFISQTIEVGCGVIW